VLTPQTSVAALSVTAPDSDGANGRPPLRRCSVQERSYCSRTVASTSGWHSGNPRDPESVLAFRRVHGADQRIIVVNMSDEDVDSIAVGPGWQIEVRSDTTDAIAWTQSLPAQTTIILKPA
jgi:hypothetical protein